MRKFLMAGVAAAALSFGSVSVAHANTIERAAQASNSPAPGTFQINLGGKLFWWANYNGYAPHSFAEGVKLSNYAFNGTIRLYPGFEAQTQNGIEYGVKAELRTANIGIGVESRDAVYWCRAYGYVGTKEMGTLLFGQVDEPSSLWLTGASENFDGGWDGNIALGNLPTPFNPSIGWNAPDVGNLYATNKIVYLSPSFYGFSIGVSFEPYPYSMANTSGTFNGLGSYWDATSSTGSEIDVNDNLRRNTWNAVARYQGQFGDFGVVATGGYIGSGVVGGVASHEFHGLGVVDAGLSMTYAGFQVGGHIDYGNFNNGYTLTPRGSRKSLFYTAGGSYSYGPEVVGAQWFDSVTPGAHIADSTLMQLNQGIYVGSVYTVTRGIDWSVGLYHGERHQTGWDFLANNGDGTNGAANNTTIVNGVATGFTLSW